LKHTILWGLLLTAAWWLWSAHVEPLIVIFGVGSIIVTLYFFARMDRFADDHPPYELGLRPIWYIPYILWEIVKANLDVARIIISPKMNIQPRMFDTEATQKTTIGQVIYANSITLTPGTITCDMRDEGGKMMFKVHALTADSKAGVEAGDMDKRCTRLEGGGS
jgi:multicomponent Na+:H+ antiporter subunit E